MSEVLFAIGKMLLWFMGSYYIFIIICVIVGVFLKKDQAVPYIETDDMLRTAVLICARNEEKVVGNLIDSLNKQNYPKDKIQVFVVAHNCTDETARVSAEYGAIVFEKNAPEDTCKGQALDWGIRQLQEKYPSEFESLVIFDADNIAGKNFVYEVNRALQNGSDIVQGFRASKNHYANWISELFALFWIIIVHFHSRPLAWMGLRGAVSGTGFAVKMSLLSEGWNTKTMLEDVEFSMIHTMKGHGIDVITSAVFYDEQPTKLKPALAQRYRWSVAGTQLLKRYFAEVIHYMRGHFLIGLRLLFDCCCNIFILAGIIGEFLVIISQLLASVSVAELAASLAVSALWSWIFLMVPAIMTIIREKLGFFRNIRTILLFPAFMFVSFVFGFVSFFDRSIKWYPIVHEDTTTIDQLENEG